MRFCALSLLAASLLAQNAPAPPAAAKPAPRLPADFMAYQEAGRVKEPQAKIAAYEKFLKDFPGSAQTYSARRAIFENTVKLHKGDRAKILGTAKSLMAASPNEHHIRLANAIAGKLHEENLFPAEAEKYAKKAVDSPGSDSQRAAAQETLGQIYRKAGKLDKAERWLKRALISDPASAEAALALGDMALEKGRDADALAYFSQARLTKPSKAVIAKLDAAWRKQHNGSAGGLDAYLNERYNKLFPSPIHAKPYEKSAQRSARVVLAEVHTGAGCPPCVAADLAFDAALERYSRSDVAVVMYHQHIPRPDPMTNDASAAIWKEREGRGVPTFLIDGKPKTGGGLREHAAKLETEIRSAIDARLDVPPGAQLGLTAARHGDAVRVTAKFDGPAENTKLRLVLVEKMVTYSGENGIRFHPMVARGIHTIATPGPAQDHTFDLGKVAFELKDHLDRFEKKDDRHNPDGDYRFFERKDQIDTSNLAVVAYVENGKEVLQAAYVDLRQ